VGRALEEANLGPSVVVCGRYVVGVCVVVEGRLWLLGNLCVGRIVWCGGSIVCVCGSSGDSSLCGKSSGGVWEHSSHLCVEK